MEISLFRAFCLGFSLLFSFSASAQIYTDEVQVVEGLGGKVGIGTSILSQKLHVDGNVVAGGPEAGYWQGFKSNGPTGMFGFQQNDKMLMGIGGNVYSRGFSANAMGIFNGSTDAEDIYLYNRNNPSADFLVLKSDGNVGIGTTSPGAKLVVYSGAVHPAKTYSTANGEGLLLDAYYTGDANFTRYADIVASSSDWTPSVMRFFTKATYGGNYERLRIESDGRIGIGLINPSQMLSVNGNASKSSGGNWEVNSDARLKTNITQLNSDATLNKLLQLKGVTYEWADDKTGINRPMGIQYGFTAQNIQEVFPELVEEDNLGYLQTAYGTYDAMMIEALRALNEKVERLENENQALKSENRILKESEQENANLISGVSARLEQLELIIANGSN